MPSDWSVKENRPAGKRGRQTNRCAQETSSLAPVKEYCRETAIRQVVKVSPILIHLL